MLTAFVVYYALHFGQFSVDKPRFITVLERTAQLSDIRTDLILPNVVSAFANETPDYPAELLIALAWSESRLDPTVRTGHVCGVLQVAAPPTASACGNLMSGYAAGVDELQELARDRRTHNLIDVLLYRACGNAAFDGTCTKQRWVYAVLARARRLGMHHVRPLS